MAPQEPPSAQAAPRRASACALVPFDTSPFPFDGLMPGTDVPFLDARDGDRRGHTSPRGGVYWEDQAYSDRRVLLCIPEGFDPAQPALIVVYFHGNASILERDVCDRQRVPQQVAGSGLNAVLVAPQLAVDALDSSAGRFWEPGAFAAFLHEAAARVASLWGGAGTRQRLERAPVVLVAYSGGYLPAAWAADVGGAGERLRGVVLMDALYGEEERFADWIARRRADAFFLSTYTASTRDWNMRLQELLARRGLPFRPSPRFPLVAGSVSFLDSGGEADHGAFVSRAWTEDPLQEILAQIPGFRRPAD